MTRARTKKAKEALQQVLTMCRNLPSGEGAKRPLCGPRVHLPLKENTWSHHQCLFEEIVRKNQKDNGLRILKIRVRELFTHGEGISTLCVRHKGQQPLIKCGNHDFKIMYFPFLCFFMYFLAFLCCLLFVPFYVFYVFGVDKGVPLAPTYPQLR